VINQKFGRLTVKTEAEPYISRKGKKQRKWLCECECGNTKEVLQQALKSGSTISCGCYNASKNRTHGKSSSREYNIWRGMKKRCHLESDENYSQYGGSGIEVCKEWRESFEQFYKDMGDAPKDFTIDRINNNKGYFKENCRWASAVTQNQNRGNNKSNSSGYKGVCAFKDKWKAYISINKKQTVLGIFDTKEEAYQVRLEAESKYYI